MLINLVKTVICFYLCFTVTSSYTYYKNSDRTSNKKNYPKMVNSYSSDNTYYKQSRYTKFDKVMTRIDNLNDEEDNVSDEGVYRIRHKGWSNRKFVTTTPTTTTTEADLFDTYDDFDDDFDDYDDTLDDDDDDEFEYADDEDDDEDANDPFFNSFYEEIQAEEQPSSTAPPRTVSKLTEYKWNNFGSREKVEETMRQQLHLNPSKEELKAKAVLDHYTRVNQQSKCLTPLPRVISVQQEHPDNTKTYLPACTVLHRCAEDSGCCRKDTRCQYKTRVLVALYFYSKSVGQEHNIVEKLYFYNHTECECKDSSEYIPTDNVDLGLIFKSRLGKNGTTEQSDLRCNCPRPFQASVASEKCSCDCHKDDHDCITLKKGKEHFSMTNRLCIQDNDCGLPTCEYGAYMFTEGKCPTKQDKLEEFRKIKLK